MVRTLRANRRDAALHARRRERVVVARMPAPSPCKLVYLDIGTNIGDSIQAFARKQPEKRLGAALQAAGASDWDPRTTCVYGFEPNPRHTSLLHSVQAALSGSFAHLKIFTETAIGGPEQLRQPLWVVQGADSKRGVGAYLSATKPASGSARPITTFSLSSFLRNVCMPRHGASTPVVMRLDIEGVEYDVLPDLITSGLGREMLLTLTLEWHVGAKKQFLGEKERGHMQMLDHRFLQYPFRCGNGVCGDGRVRFANSTLESTLEKSLAFYLHRAGITFADAYFDVPQNAGKRTAIKLRSPQNFTATRERRSRFDGLGARWEGAPEVVTAS